MGTSNEMGEAVDRIEPVLTVFFAMNAVCLIVIIVLSAIDAMWVFLRRRRLRQRPPVTPTLNLSDILTLNRHDHPAIDPDRARLREPFGHRMDLGDRHVALADKHRLTVLDALEIAREVGLGIGNVDLDLDLDLDHDPIVEHLSDHVQ